MSSQVFAHDGESGFTGTWGTITSAKGFDSKLLDIPIEASHYVRYSSGGTTELVNGHKIWGVVKDQRLSVGDTTNGSPIIAGFTSNSVYGLGRYVTGSAGFASTTTFMQIIGLATDGTTVTVDTNANGSNTNINLDQYPDAIVVGNVVDTGTWGAGTATGILLLKEVRGVFSAGNISITAQNGDAATIAENVLPIIARTPPKAALITAETAAINFTIDGTAPTAAAGTNHGHQMGVGQSYVVRGYHNIKKFQCINSVNGNNAVVKYSLFF
jgi:hypothetical protein